MTDVPANSDLSKKDRPVKDRLVDSALAMAAARPWAEVSFQEICEKAGLEIRIAQEYCDHKCDVLAAYSRRLDFKMLEESGPFDPDETPRERLFELMMTRFELLNDNRQAELSFLGSLPKDPAQGISALPQLGQTVRKMAIEAGLEVHGLQGIARIGGLKMVYLYTLKSWIDDESADLSATMAALDKALDWAESAGQSLDKGPAALFEKLRGRFFA